jgi:hypothetical protein
MFTPDQGSIGAHLNDLRAGLSADDPLLVVTGTDMVIFAGSGREPLMESFRKSTRGFIELTSISHVGVAVPFIARMFELGDPAWRTYTLALIDQLAKVRAINSDSYWRDTVSVAAWVGLESKITDLVDYTCDVTIEYLTRALEDTGLLEFENVRRLYLDPTDSALVPVPINDMMAGTFGLVTLDMAHRIIGWLRNQRFDWQRMMVLVSGKAGRPTAALTWRTNFTCHLLWQASEQRLPPDRLYIAPHAPSLNLEELTNTSACNAIERQFRQMWFSTRVTVEVGRAMFANYPSFKTATNNPPVIDATTKTLTQLPAIRSPDDRLALMTRLRFVMEDPTQQLINAVADYIIDQLCANGNRATDVTVGGFTNISYPRMSARRAAS